MALEGKKGKDNAENALMAKLHGDVQADEETHKLDGKATKNQRTEKKEFRRRVIDYVLEKLPGLQTRSKRAGLVHNFLRGLGLSGPQGIYDKAHTWLYLAIFFSSGRNRPFSSYHVPLFQNESPCTTFHVKMSLICIKMNL